MWEQECIVLRRLSGEPKSTTDARLNRICFERDVKEEMGRKRVKRIENENVNVKGERNRNVEVEDQELKLADSTVGLLLASIGAAEHSGTGEFWCVESEELKLASVKLAPACVESGEFKCAKDISAADSFSCDMVSSEKSLGAVAKTADSFSCDNVKSVGVVKTAERFSCDNVKSVGVVKTAERFSCDNT